MRALPKYQLFARLSVLVFVVVVAVTWRSLGNLSLKERSSSAAGQTMTAPVGLQSAAGGGVIAVRWQAVPSASSYQVYRNQALVRTLAVTGAPAATLGATVYYDTAVTSGQSYTYQVTAVSTAGTASSKSSPLAITAPALVTPAPTVEVDQSAPTDLKRYLQDGATFLRYWYPILADRLVGVDHRVPGSLKVAINPASTCPVPVAVSSRTITVCAGYARAKPSDLSVFTRAGAHVAAAHSAAVPGYLTSGLASWAGDWSVGLIEAEPAPSATYDDAAAFSYFLSWASHAYNKPNLARELNLAAYHGTYTTDTFRRLAGSSLGEMWSSRAGHRVTSPGQLATSGFCIETNGSRVALATCGSGSSQQFVYATTDANTASALIKLPQAGAVCLTAAGTSGGSPVSLGDCNPRSPSALWQTTASGGVMNPASGRCLRPVGAKAAAGTGLELWDCTGTDASQRWTLPPA